MKRDLKIKYIKTLEDSRRKGFITEKYFNNELKSIRTKPKTFTQRIRTLLSPLL